MELVNVKTQAELDKAIANGDMPVCREGFYRLSGNATARLSDNATAELFGNATAELFDNATARLSDNATAELFGNATAELFDNATAELFDNATAELFDNATARLFDNATAELFDNATARLFDNATAELFGNATAELSGNATAELFGNATARLFDNATAEGSKYTAIHRLSKTTKATGGGVVIDVPEITTVEEFCDYYSVEIKRGNAILFKAVDENWASSHGAVYEVGATVTCDDWSSQASCGGGLHFSPRPFMTRKYSDGPKLLACQVKLKDVVVIADCGQPDKVKASACKVLFEVDEDGKKLEPVEAKVAA